MAAADLAFYPRPAYCAPRGGVAFADPRVACRPAHSSRAASRVARQFRRRASPRDQGRDTRYGRFLAGGQIVHRPGFYRGQLTLFSPEQREPGLPSLESVWRSHARTVMVVETAGTHLTMLSTRHAETTAACVTRHLPAASLV